MSKFLQRRSKQGDRSSRSHVSIPVKSATAINPPKKVIKAIRDYDPTSDDSWKHDEFKFFSPSDFLKFNRGDYFHVIGRENDEKWYEACNPSENTRGLVPVNAFEVLGKTARDSSGSGASGGGRIGEHDSGYAEKPGAIGTIDTSDLGSRPGHMSRMMSKGTGAMVYGIVQYDFNAERPDELEAKAGEAIIVIAQSNPEWFVAKPIGRLGGPGLIPASFIEIRDMATGQAVPDSQEAIRRAGVPKVEQWKKMAAEYKASSITLGKFETQSVQQDMGRMSLSNKGGYAQGNGQNGYAQGLHQRSASKANAIQDQYLYNPQSQHNHYAVPVSASVPRYCYANDKFWFIIEAIMEDGRHWELSRFYQDFYDFQIRLLKAFPDEAGNTGGPRTLPYMPGPVTYVTDNISNGRRQSLDEYVKNLLAMPTHVSRSQLVAQLFAAREGDFEVDPDAAGDEYRSSGGSQLSSIDTSQEMSRQSSQGNLDGSGYPGLSAPPPRPTHQAKQSISQQDMNQAAAASSHQRNGSELQPPAPLLRQDSSFTQDSQGSNSQRGPPDPGAPSLKIKVHYGPDIFAIRMPMDVNYEEIKEKMRARLQPLGGKDFVFINEDNHEQQIANDDDLDAVLEGRTKVNLRIPET
ncbi:MAG: hypothetical protein M1819_003170 [Sarea resinae]|nr:MAG: hypothetical protein M1819_003170 [Sarea resinae]